MKEIAEGVVNRREAARANAARRQREQRMDGQSLRADVDKLFRKVEALEKEIEELKKH
jgi:hypothetical protein